MTGLGEKLIDKRIAAMLASMGGDLLSTHGKRAKLIGEAERGERQLIRAEGDYEALALAALGGYMLERFGDGDDGNSTSHVEDEFPPPTGPTGSVEP